ncbi:hypothetical protein D3C85_1566660 [compost metagenome]
MWVAAMTTLARAFSSGISAAASVAGWRNSTPLTLSGLTSFQVSSVVRPITATLTPPRLKTW